MAKKTKKEDPQADGQGQAVVSIDIDSMVDHLVDAAIDLVAKRQVAAQAARQHDLGPGGVNEAMKAVGTADTVFTQAVLALVEGSEAKAEE